MKTLSHPPRSSDELSLISSVRARMEVVPAPGAGKGLLKEMIPELRQRLRRSEPSRGSRVNSVMREL